MNRNLIALVIPLVLLASCSKPMTAEQKIAMLENQKLEIFADLHRQQAECQAQGIEFANMPRGREVVIACLDGYRLMVESNAALLSLFDKRIADIKQEKQRNTPFNQFDPPKQPALIPFDGKLDGEK